MLATVDEFCTLVTDNLETVVRNLTLKTGRGNPQEQAAWRRSLPALSEVLDRAKQAHKPLGQMHLSLGHLALEYRLPAANAWCDAVLLGRNRQGESQALVVELKHWDTAGDEPGPCESLMLRRGEEAHHPSDQVRGYTLYCRRFHSAVLDHSAQVDGCVYFTRPSGIARYRQPPNHLLVNQFPVFSLHEEQDSSRFSEFVASRLSAADAAFARAFSEGYYVQDRNILAQVAKSLRESSARPFVLLDEQRRGFSICLNAIEQAQRSGLRRQVVIVHGPPGSGKSALAVNLWIECAEKFQDRGNIVLVTTSSCQSTNWQRIFEANSQIAGARFLTLTSNNFNPGLTGQIVASLKKKGHAMDYHRWQECLDAFTQAGHRTRVPDFNHHISIVDEAHALINPETHDIGFASGWCVQAGPQAYHIMRASKVSVFLLDSRQSYRDNETTSIADLRDFAARLGADVTEVSLEGHQFRCGGSVEYMQWVDALLQASQPVRNTGSWRRSVTKPENPFRFEIVDSPADLDARLTPLAQGGDTVRLVSSYSVPWATSRDPETGKKWDNPARYRRYMETLAPEACDFQIKTGSELWSRPWNFAPGEDYTLFIQAPQNTRMGKNPLSEVGCPYVLRGFDYDYLGVLWLEDLVWRNGKWLVQPTHVHETAIKSTLSAARKDLERGHTDTPEARALFERVAKAYRILLSRAIKGVFVYVRDAETHAHLEALLTPLDVN